MVNIFIRLTLIFVYRSLNTYNLQSKATFRNFHDTFEKLTTNLLPISIYIFCSNFRESQNKSSKFYFKKGPLISTYKIWSFNLFTLTSPGCTCILSHALDMLMHWITLLSCFTDIADNPVRTRSSLIYKNKPVC